MTPTFIRFGQMVIAWSSIIFLPKKSFIKYLPTAFVAALLVMIVSSLAIPLNFWRVNGGIRTKIFNDFSFTFGPFFIGTIWIFHLTYRKFSLYFLLNIIMNTLLAFPLSTLYQKLKVYKLNNFKSIHVFFTYIIFSLILYGYQVTVDKIKN